MRLAPRIAGMLVGLAAVAGALLLRFQSRESSLKGRVDKGAPSSSVTPGSAIKPSDVPRSARPLTRSFPAEAEIKKWKESLDEAEVELSSRQNVEPSKNRIRSEGELAKARLAELFVRAGINVEQYSNSVGSARMNLLRAPRLQAALMGALQVATDFPLFWDKVHGRGDREKWLSPVYRRSVRDWVSMDPTTFLGGRIRFVSKTEYLPYAGVDMAVSSVAVSEPARLIEWAWQRRMPCRLLAATS